MKRDGSNTPRSFPLAVVGQEQSEWELVVTVFDQVKWDAVSQVEKEGLYETAMMYGHVEKHGRFPIATVQKRKKRDEPSI